MDPEVEKKLKEGAIFLGKMWRDGQRCSSGWDIKVTEFPEGEDAFKVMKGWACRCSEKSKFCKGKAQWLNLAIGDLREPVDGPYGIPLMMTAEEWDLTKLTMNVEMEGIGTVSIGPNGTMIMVDLLKHMSAPEGLKSTLRVLKAFPNARVEGVQEADAPRCTRSWSTGSCSGRSSGRSSGGGAIAQAASVSG